MKEIDQKLEEITDATVDYILKIKEKTGVEDIELITSFDESEMQIFYEINVSIPIAKLRIDNGRKR